MARRRFSGKRGGSVRRPRPCRGTRWSRRPPAFRGNAGGGCHRRNATRGCRDWPGSQASKSWWSPGRQPRPISWCRRWVRCMMSAGKARSNSPARRVPWWISPRGKIWCPSSATSLQPRRCCRQWWRANRNRWQPQGCSTGMWATGSRCWPQRAIRRCRSWTTTSRRNRWRTRIRYGCCCWDSSRWRSSPRCSHRFWWWGKRGLRPRARWSSAWSLQGWWRLGARRPMRCSRRIGAPAPLPRRHSQGRNGPGRRSGCRWPSPVSGLSAHPSGSGPRARPAPQGQSLPQLRRRVVNGVYSLKNYWVYVVA